ncbi:MAG: (2Fe-2S) ferredoxin domain-containing protein [Aphanocapsa sp. GSE-SYN-MK-11-07L]|jgi:(2Fe-2S) ferredoxin|nr:(2Fe-2S) ferredoxin domain-containing protein [Aphanocapsa sp. GSE-SYN-MK-11-07L]
MSSAKHKTPFAIEGVFLQFEAGDSRQDGKADRATSSPKAIWIATAAGESQIKLAKSLRTNLKMSPQPGDWVKMAGHRTIDLITGEVKLKAYTLQPVSCGADLFPAELKPQVSTKPAKAKVLVCQKSDCRARGSQAVQQAIGEQLQACGLADQVTVKATGCMGCCKKGANVVFMPDKARYQQVKPAQVPALIKKHIAAAQPANTISQTTSAPTPKLLTAVQA